MANNPQGGQINVGLTDYAHQIIPDYSKIIAEADFIAPRVVTGGSVGNYPIFESKANFEAHEASRAYSGKRRRVHFAGENGTFSCQPLGLEIPLDDADPLLTAGNRTLVEQAKTRTLLSNWANGRFYRVWSTATTSGNYTAATDGDAGKWSNANIDPIVKLDGVIQQIHDATGMLPNRIGMDLGSWIKLRNHPKVLARQPGSTQISISMEQLTGMLAAPLEAKLFRAILNASGSGFGNTGTSKSAVASGKCLVFFAQDAASIDDASAFKTFSPTAEGWESVKQYRDDTCSSDVFYLDAQEALVSVAPLLAVLITVS